MKRAPAAPIARRIARFARFASFSIITFSFSTIFSTANAEATAAPKKADAGKGAVIANATCAACHGADGNTIGNAYPKIAGQYEAYLYKQLVNFKPKADAKDAERINSVMQGMVAPLSDEDMRNVAAYYASQTLKPASAKSKDTIALGQKIYRGGIPEKNVPACAACHGPTGSGIPSQFPRLSGQWGEYSETQLIAFRASTRKNNSAMATIAARLSDAEMKAVADYAAGLR